MTALDFGSAESVAGASAVTNSNYLYSGKQNCKSPWGQSPTSYHLGKIALHEWAADVQVCTSVNNPMKSGVCTTMRQGVLVRSQPVPSPNPGRKALEGVTRQALALANNQTE